MSKSNYKLTDEEFLKILKENCGMYGLTAVAIQKKYGIPYTRQAVRDRAQRHPDFIKELEEENFEIVNLTFLELMKQKENLYVRLNSAKFYAATKCKEHFNTKPGEPKTELKQQVIKIGKSVLRFFVPANKNNPLK
jgi:hypothetical protein